MQLQELKYRKIYRKYENKTLYYENKKKNNLERIT